jgi:predicted flap endonuclease-1-like 5' DNA nuclease
VRLASGAGPVVLAQTVEVEPGQLFELALSPAAGAGGVADATAGLAVRWSKAGGEPTGAPLELDLRRGDSGPVRAEGTVPEGAALARLELRLEGGTSLAVERIAFALRRPQKVPAVFLAQAPGELRIRDWQVAFEPAEPARPPPPESGLCAPTPPGMEPGEACESEGLCPRCKRSSAHHEGDLMVTAAGRAVTVGSCAGCGAPRLSYGGRPTSRPDRFIPRRLSPLRPPARAGAGPTPLPAVLLQRSPREARVRPLPPLTAIVGIGEKRAAQLAALGIDSIPKLVEADPELLARRLPGVFRQLADILIERARSLAAATAGGRPDRRTAAAASRRPQ